MITETYFLVNLSFKNLSTKICEESHMCLFFRILVVISKTVSQIMLVFGQIPKSTIKRARDFTIREQQIEKSQY